MRWQNRRWSAEPLHPLLRLGTSCFYVMSCASCTDVGLIQSAWHCNAANLLTCSGRPNISVHRTICVRGLRRWLLLCDGSRDHEHVVPDLPAALSLPSRRQRAHHGLCVRRRIHWTGRRAVLGVPGRIVQVQSRVCGVHAVSRRLVLEHTGSHGRRRLSVLHARRMVRRRVERAADVHLQRRVLQGQRLVCRLRCGRGAGRLRRQPMRRVRRRHVHC